MENSRDPQLSTIFVWEALTAGGCGEIKSASLLREGRAMWSAVVEDLLRIDGCHVVSIWHRMAGDIPMPESDRLEITITDEPTIGATRFDEYAATADRSWIIAPELDGLLAERLQRVEAVGGRFIGPDVAATQLCTDKWRLAEFLQQHNLPTPPTMRLSSGLSPTFPAIIKRRDGAGSVGCRLISSAKDWTVLLADREKVGNDPPLIVQPYLDGEAISVAAIISDEPAEIEIFPTGRQVLTDDNTFQYAGGEIPWQNRSEIVGMEQKVVELVRQTVKVIPGLRGYVGFDLLTPTDGSGPVLIEINPRLTTAYVGYRALTDDNLAARIFSPETDWQPIRWHLDSVRFTPDGQCVREPRTQ